MAGRQPYPRPPDFGAGCTFGPNGSFAADRPLTYVEPQRSVAPIAEPRTPKKAANNKPYPVPSFKPKPPSDWGSDY